MTTAIPPLSIRPAGAAGAENDADAIVALLEKATAWLAERGSDQWQDRPERRREKVHQDIDCETVHIVTLGDAPIATITIDEFADTDFWRPTDDVKSALYVHRMAVSREYTGLGVGSAMLDWASNYAMARNRRYLRLDAWRSNLTLREYYRDQHFTLVRICRRQDRGSGALFQRTTDLQLHQGPTLLTTPVQ